MKNVENNVTKIEQIIGLLQHVGTPSCACALCAAERELPPTNRKSMIIIVL